MGKMLMTGFATWATSLTGIMTIIIVMITASRLILTAVRDKHGRESKIYGNAKAVSFMVYAVTFINLIGAIFTKTKLNAASLGKSLPPIGIVMILLVFYIIAMQIAYTRQSYALCFIGSIVVVCATQLFTQPQLGHGEFNGWTFTMLIGVMLVLCFVAVGIGWKKDEAKDQTEANAQEATTAHQSANIRSEDEKPHKNIFIAVLWVLSVIAAYLAGEYSLIPKLIELFQRRSDQKSSTNATEFSQDTTIPTKPIIIDSKLVE